MCKGIGLGILRIRFCMVEGMCIYKYNIATDSFMYIYICKYTRSILDMQRYGS